ncbi:hypothetical protein PtrM4_104190 [Pyrenophora tritici-repentis]|uniref:Uncharacterized protein n=1 Tax=Pyrenophora tritici-repentis TaxID=45151 RepID=A0A317A929_9PLEO|nr:hypothetical protein PtrM4_104190 [Pyrenophora tritici-repentis]
MATSTSPSLDRFAWCLLPSQTTTTRLSPILSPDIISTLVTTVPSSRNGTQFIYPRWIHHNHRRQNPPSDSRIRKPLRKRQKNTIKPTIFDVPRARNCGADNSFLSTETTGMMDYTCGGSSTEEEDMTEIENEYRNRMTTDNTDRPAETIFGKGVKVWKSFSGSGRIYADLEDHIKKQQREKLLWKDEKQKLGMGAGGKRKRGEKMTNEGVSGLPVKYAREMDYSMQVKTETSDEDQMLTDQMSDKKQSSNHNEPGTYTDGNITYPDLPVLINTFVANTGIDLPPQPHRVRVEQDLPTFHVTSGGCPRTYPSSGYTAARTTSSSPQ